MRCKIALFACLIFLLTSCANNSTGTEEIPSQLELLGNKYLSAMAENNRFNGVVLVTKKEDVLFQSKVGYSNRSLNSSFSDTSVFLIGSITKTFTAAAILQLADKGKLTLNDKLSIYFHDFPNSNKVTIKQLLTHTSGLRDYHEFGNWMEESLRKTLIPLEVIETVRKNPYRNKPGEKFSYSNTGYIFLGLIIEEVSGLPFSQYISDNIIKPLNLSNTGVIKNGMKPKGLTEGYRTNPKGSFSAGWINYNQPFSSGNMYSNLYDLEHFTRSVFQGDLFSKELLEQLKTDNSSKYGYGWGIRKFDTHTFYGHNGAMNGFVGGINYLPEEELFIGFLTNDDNTPRNVLSRTLTNLATNHPVSIPAKRNYKNLSYEQREKYMGHYLIKPGDTLTVFLQNEMLFMQETGQEQHELFCFEEQSFDFEKLEFDAVFTDSSNNKFNQLSFQHEGNQFLSVKAIK